MNGYVHCLVREGICQISQEDYERLVELYQSPHISSALLGEFSTIVHKKLLVINPHKFIRLLGDELADRGRHDYFILTILHMLSKNKVPFEILISNHGLVFIEAYESSRHGTGAKIPLSDHYIQSLLNLRKSIKHWQLSPREVDDIINNVYKKHLKLISYSISDDYLSIYSHAS